LPEGEKEKGKVTCTGVDGEGWGSELDSAARKNYAGLGEGKGSGFTPLRSAARGASQEGGGIQRRPF